MFVQRLLQVAVSIPLIAVLIAGCGGRAARSTSGAPPAGVSVNALEQSCLRQGWQRVNLVVDGLERRALWKGPREGWKNGAILVLHGGGGQADHFCAGGKLVQPQVQFAEMALQRGFAVFALDATTDKVTDSKGRPCGKRFDFSVLSRPNLDLPYIEKIITETVPTKRPKGSNPAVFVTGLSTGGYMTTRAAGELGDKITAFAPVSAGDPYGTDTVCDTTLSGRTSAKGILVDRETSKEIVEDGACLSSKTTREATWPATQGRRPPFKQFQHEADGIVDISCMRKATTMLERNGFPTSQPYVIPARGRKDPFKHLWLEEYNAPLLDFFASQAAKGRSRRRNLHCGLRPRRMARSDKLTGLSGHPVYRGRSRASSSSNCGRRHGPHSSVACKGLQRPLPGKLSRCCWRQVMAGLGPRLTARKRTARRISAPVSCVGSTGCVPCWHLSNMNACRSQLASPRFGRAASSVLNRARPLTLDLIRRPARWGLPARLLTQVRCSRRRVRNCRTTFTGTRDAVPAAPQRHLVGG